MPSTKRKHSSIMDIIDQQVQRPENNMAALVDDEEALLDDSELERWDMVYRTMSSLVW